MQRKISRYQLQYAGKLNSSLVVLLIISGTFTFAFGLFNPIYAIFVESIGEHITVAANAAAVFSLVAGLLTFLTGRWENKIKETELGIAWSQFILGFAYILYYLTDGILMLYLAQAFLGAGMAFFWPAFHSTYGKHTNKSESPWQWSLYDGLGYLLPAAAAVIGGVIVERYGFDLLFILMAILSFMCGLFIMVLPRRML